MILFIGFNSIIPIYFETEKKNQIKSISIEEIKKLFSPITIPFHTEYGKVDEFIDNSVKQCVKKAASNTNCSENERINTLNAVNRFQGCADTLLCDLFDVFSYFLVIFRFFFQATFSTRDLPLRLIWYLAHGVITICCRTWSGSLQVVDWSQDRIFNQIATVKSLPPILQNDQWNKYNRNSNCRYYFSQLSPLWVTQQTTFTSLYELIWPLFKVI